MTKQTNNLSKRKLDENKLLEKPSGRRIFKSALNIFLGFVVGIFLMMAFGLLMNYYDILCGGV